MVWGTHYRGLREESRGKPPYFRDSLLDNEIGEWLSGHYRGLREESTVVWGAVSVQYRGLGDRTTVVWGTELPWFEGHTTVV